MTPGHVADRSFFRFVGVAKNPAFKGVEGGAGRAKMKKTIFTDQNASRTSRRFNEI